MGNQPISTSPPAKRSWFSSLSRARGNDTVAKPGKVDTAGSASQSNSKLEAHPAAEGPQSLADSPAQIQEHAVMNTNANTTNDDSDNRGIAQSPSHVVTPSSILPASSSIDNEVPPPITTPALSSASRESLLLGNVKENSKQDLSERDQSHSVSSLNPSTSRFMLRLPLLGRPKIPIEQVVQAAQESSRHKNEDSDKVECKDGASESLLFIISL